MIAEKYTKENLNIVHPQGDVVYADHIKNYVCKFVCPFCMCKIPIMGDGLYASI